MNLGLWFLNWLDNEKALRDARDENVELGVELRRAVQGWTNAEREVLTLTDALSECMNERDIAYRKLERGEAA